MKSKLLSAFAVMVIVALPALGRPPNPVIEDGHEYEGSMLTLPASVAGEVKAIACNECLSRRYTFGEQAEFFIGKQPVSFADFKRYVTAKPSAPLTIVTKTETNVITRMRVSDR